MKQKFHHDHPFAATAAGEAEWTFCLTRAFIRNPLRIGRPISFGCIAAKKICDVPLITNIRLIFMLPKVDII